LQKGWGFLNIYQQGKTNMTTITIDNINYELETLNDEAKNQLASIQFVDGELQRLNAQIAVLQTARLAYFNALKKELPPVQGELLTH